MRKNIFSFLACRLIQNQSMLGRFRINCLTGNLDLVKINCGVENTSEKITQNHYTEIIIRELGNGQVREYISTLEYYQNCTQIMKIGSLLLPQTQSLRKPHDKLCSLWEGVMAFLGVFFGVKENEGKYFRRNSRTRQSFHRQEGL